VPLDRHDVALIVVQDGEHARLQAAAGVGAGRLEQ
jgi:hypothetical protein